MTAGKRDQLAGISGHLVALPALERPLVGEYLSENRVIGGHAVDLDRGSAGEIDCCWPELLADVLTDLLAD
jgi:hypothetical protein